MRRFGTACWVDNGIDRAGTCGMLIPSFDAGVVANRRAASWVVPRPEGPPTER